jgi:predicted HTH transcriptional regulator
MYDTPEDLLAAIAGHEDSYLEFKEVLSEGHKLILAGEGQALPWLARTLCCFANSDGGVVVLGVSDSGTVVGLPEGTVDDLMQLVVNAGRNNCDPPLDHLLLLDAMVLPGEPPRTVLKVAIRPDYFAVHSLPGQLPTQRVGNTCRQVTMEALPRLLARRGSAFSPVDERPVLSASMGDLDEAAVSTWLARRVGSVGTARNDEELTVDLRRLRNTKLAADDERGEPHPTVAGLLLFGRRPQDHLNGAYIDFVVYDGLVPDADRQRDARILRGTIIQQIENCVDALRASPAGALGASKDGLGRESHPRYSMRALQEAVVNAVVHRDYLLAGSQVRVFVFDDRVEVSSPGRLPNSLTPDDLYAGAQPYRRNQVIAGFLRDYESPLTGRAYMEARGEGFLALVRESEALSGRRPELDLGSESVTLTIWAADARAGAGDT